MKRRTLLKTGVVAGAAALWPAWIARAFDSACGNDRTVELFDAYRAARRTKKPLLVFVIPNSREQKWRRGELFGQALNHGDDETLATLSLAVLACATLDDLAKLITLPPSKREPWVVRIDTLERKNSAHGYALALPARPEDPKRGEDWDAFLVREAAAVDVEISAVSQFLRQALQTAQPAPGARPEVLEFEVTNLAQRIRQDEVPEAAEVAPHARELWSVLSLDPRDRERMLHALAQTMRTLLQQPIQGSRWATGFGCGVTIENDDERGAYGCGMGHVPKKSQRFLYFFTKRPYGQ